MNLNNLFSRLKAKRGRGHFDHKGIPGHRGGSAPSGFSVQSSSKPIGKTPYGGTIYDKPLLGSDAHRKNYTLGQAVEFDYASAIKNLRGSGKVIGFALNDIVIEDKESIYFVDGKNVFKRKI